MYNYAYIMLQFFRSLAMFLVTHSSNFVLSTLNFRAFSGIYIRR